MGGSRSGGQHVEGFQALHPSRSGRARDFCCGIQQTDIEAEMLCETAVVTSAEASPPGLDRFQRKRTRNTIPVVGIELRACGASVASFRFLTAAHEVIACVQPCILLSQLKPRSVLYHALRVKIMTEAGIK